MLLTLLLALGGADLKAINLIVWALALVSWLPQLLVAWLVLRKPRPLLTQLLLLLSPLLLAATFGYWAVLLLLFYIYSEPQFILWLPLALLPTFGAIFLAIDRRGQLLEAPQPKVPSQGSSTGNRVRWLALGGLGLLLVSGMAWWALPRRQAPDKWAEPVADELYPMWTDSLYDRVQQEWEARDRQGGQSRGDSLRF